MIPLRDRRSPFAAQTDSAWWDWYEYHTLLREAEATILLDPAFPADPFARDP
jgi:hypothetical protein